VLEAGQKQLDLTLCNITMMIRLHRLRECADIVCDIYGYEEWIIIIAIKGQCMLT